MSMATLSVHTNSGAARAHRNMSGFTRQAQAAVNRLSSGVRAESAADHSAAVARTQTMRAQHRGMQMALRNANDAITLANTAEGSYDGIAEILIRMRELAVEAANDSLQDTERSLLNTEFVQLRRQIDRIAEAAEWNGITLLDGNANGTGTLQFQVGFRATSDDTISIDLNDMRAAALSIDTQTIATQATARDAIDALDGAQDSTHTRRAEIGSVLRSLGTATDFLAGASANYGEGIGLIRDADVGRQSAEFTRAQVLRQASVAMMSRSQDMATTVLRLLDG